MDSLSLSSTLLHLKIKASKLRLHGFRIFQRLGGNTKGRNHIVESKGTLRRVSLDTDVSQTHLLSVMSRLEPHAHLHAPKILLKALSSSFFFLSTLPNPFKIFDELSSFLASSTTLNHFLSTSETHTFYQMASQYSTSSPKVQSAAPKTTSIATSSSSPKLCHTIFLILSHPDLIIGSITPSPPYQNDHR